MIEPTDLRELLPSYYDGVREMQILMDVENQGAKQAADATQRVKDNFYIQTAHEEVVSYYERFYGINTKSDDTLQQRRFRVLVRMISQPPFTKHYLQEQLEMLGTTVKITERPQRYQLEVETSLSGRGEVDELPYLFKTMVPANIEVISTNKIEIQSEQTVYLAHSATYTRVYTTTNDFNAEYVSEAVMNSGNAAQSWSVIATK